MVVFMSFSIFYLLINYYRHLLDFVICKCMNFNPLFLLLQLADTVSLHFLSLMETLMECNSEILARVSAANADDNAILSFSTDI